MTPSTPSSNTVSSTSSTLHTSRPSASIDLPVEQVQDGVEAAGERLLGHRQAPILVTTMSGIAASAATR